MIYFDGIIFSLQDAGGISVYFHELLKRAASHDDTRNSYLAYYNENFISSITDYNIRSARLPSRIFERYRSMDIDYPKNLQVFHSSYYRVCTPPKAKLANVVTVHDFVYEKFVNGPKRAIHSLQKYNAINHADAIICVSSHTKSDLLHFLPHIPEERIYVIPNSASEKFYYMENKRDHTQNEVLYIGLRAKHKNFETAVKSVSKLKDCRLTVVGGGELNSCERRLLSNYLKERFEHKHFVSTENLNRLYNRALCLLYPSNYEGFGIPLLEAMAAGCPVICSDKASIPEIVGDAAIKISGNNPAEYCEALGTLTKRDSLYSNLVQKGLLQAKKFSWDSTFEKTCDVYRKVH